MVYSKKHFLAASVVILIIVGFATSLTGEDLIKERVACSNMLYYTFNDDVGSNLMTAYYTLDEDITTAIFKSLQTQGSLYKELNMPKVPLSNYLHNYMYYMITNININMKVIPDAISFCAVYFDGYDVSCPQTLRLIGLSSFKRSHEAKVDTLGTMYFFWTEESMKESYTIRSNDKDYAITPAELSIEPKTIYFLDHVYVAKYYWYIAQVLLSPSFVEVDKLYDPDNYCKNAVIDDADQKELKKENVEGGKDVGSKDHEDSKDPEGTKHPKSDAKDDEQPVVVLF